jgi:hypothetical protein
MYRPSDYISGGMKIALITSFSISPDIIIVAGLNRFCYPHSGDFYLENIMQGIFINQVAFQPDLENLARRLHVRPGSEDFEDFIAYMTELSAIAVPKIFYKIAFIDEREEEGLVIDGIYFHSRVLCVNLAEVHRVFAYVATCGLELAERRKQEDDILHQFWADALMEAALHTAVEFLRVDLAARYHSTKIAVMNPGSLPDWPIIQQEPFFQLLGDGSKFTGVTLTESMLMVPAKSTTGLLFETESGYENCSLCPRQTCPNRRAAYDPTLMDQKYRQ